MPTACVFCYLLRKQLHFPHPNELQVTSLGGYPKRIMGGGLCYGLSLVTPWQVGEAVPLDASRIGTVSGRRPEAEELLGVVET